MDPAAATFSYFLALGIVVLQAVCVALLLLFILSKRGKFVKLSSTVRRAALPAVFLLTFAGTAATLMYSEVWGFVPCGLCWLQRIFLYPHVVLAGVALVKKEGIVIADYLIALSIPGAAVALYQHYLQMGGTELVGCPTAGGDCAARLVFEFGYITLPLAAATVFCAIILLALFMRRRED